VVTAVGHELLEEEGALTMPLVGHGPNARRRIHVRHQWATLFFVALLAVPTYLLEAWWFDRLPWWGPLALLVAAGALNALVAENAWRNLGHGLTDRHLVVQTGAVVRTREVLELAGIIGWRVDQTFFQRRRGLADLLATTAAGSEVVTAPDIPVELAVALARRATPGMLDDFLM
jgi:putative membrane protein